MYMIFGLLAWAGFIGIFFLTSATTGVGILAAGCLAGIMSRVLQADKHHKQLMDRGR